MENETQEIELKPIEITGALRKGDLFCWYGFRQEIAKDQYNTVPSVRSDRPMHEDLRFAFDALTIHLPIILQELKPADVPDINANITGMKLSDENQELLDLFKVIGIEVDPDDKSVSLIGRKSLALGILPIKTPFVKFAGSYSFAMELNILVDRLIKEVQLYIEGKQAPNAKQQDLFENAGEGDGEGGDGEPGENAATTPKKRGRPKKLQPPAAQDSADPAAGDGLTELERANLGNDQTEPLSTFFKDPKKLTEENQTF